jgi:hypothetical protein
MTAPVRDPEGKARERLYKAGREPQLVDVPALHFLMVDGEGDPNTAPAYREAVEALFALAYALKFALKRTGGPDERVSPLEGLWWSDDMGAFAVERRGDWRWTMMIAQPEAVTPALVVATLDEVRRKKALPALDRLRFAPYAEGRAAQILHLGPYAAEGPTIARLHAFIREQGLTFDGRVQKHHEIYLSDPRRAAPERMRTILRQPVA